MDGMLLEHVSEFKFLGVFWKNQILMRQSVIRRGWQVGEGLQVLLGPCLMLGVYSLSMLGSSRIHCLCLFLCMVVRQ